jgi:hypothetical protein
MTGQEIISNLAAITPFKPQIGGTIYALPTLDWLQNTFYPYFKQQLFDYEVNEWKVKWECRDFASAYRVFAQICNTETPNTPGNADILAVGEVWFIPDANKYGTAPGQLSGTPGDGHAINIAFTDKGIVFLDPQFGQGLWQITPTELSSIYETLRF